MSEELINKMVDRFLSWELPETICPDGGLSLDKDTPKEPGWWPTGTNMLSATEAKAMVLHMLGDDLRAVVAPAEPFAYAIQNKSHAFLTWPDPEQGNHHILAYKADPDYTVTELYTSAPAEPGEDAKCCCRPGPESGVLFVSKSCPIHNRNKPDPAAAMVGSMVGLNIAPGLESVEAISGMSRYSIRGDIVFKDAEGGYMAASQTLPYIASLRAEVERLTEHNQALIDASGQQCGCGYDSPEDVCLGHRPMHMKQKQRIADLERQLSEARAEAATLADEKLRLLQHCGALEVSIRDDDTDACSESWRSLPQHLQESVNTAAEAIDEAARLQEE